MFLYKRCRYVLQSQAERSRASRQISLTPDTYSSISAQKYLTKVSQTTLTHPHNTHSYTQTLDQVLTQSKHICFFVTDCVDLLCEIPGAFTFVMLPLFFQFLLLKYDCYNGNLLFFLLWVMMGFLFPFLSLDLFPSGFLCLGFSLAVTLPPCPPPSTS